MSPTLQIVLMALAAVVLILVAVKLVISLIQRNPEKRERRRRELLNKEGRVGDAMVLEVGEGMVYYAYTLRGVRYENSQDISTLGAHLPEDLDRLIGPVHIKYSPQNPYNSILLCEEWSGVPERSAQAAAARRA